MQTRCLSGFILLAALLCGGPAHASRINTDTSKVVDSPTGPKIVSTETQPTRVFEFGPFTGHKNRVVPGFSDPLGTGADPSLKLFSGAVKNMDLLGDYHPSNPYDLTDLTPSPESVETLGMINEILHGVAIPGKAALLRQQLNLKNARNSKVHPKPRTSEMSPLVLSGFGSVSEFTKPIRLHWTHCPNYAFKRNQFKNAMKGNRMELKPGQVRPTVECIVI